MLPQFYKLTQFYPPDNFRISTHKEVKKEEILMFDPIRILHNTKFPTMNAGGSHLDLSPHPLEVLRST